MFSGQKAIYLHFFLVIYNDYEENLITKQPGNFGNMISPA